LGINHSYSAENGMIVLIPKGEGREAICTPKKQYGDFNPSLPNPIAPGCKFNGFRVHTLAKAMQAYVGKDFRF